MEKVNVEIKDVSDELHLKVHVGSGSWGDLPIEFSTSASHGSPIITVGDKTYIVPMTSIVEAVVEHNQKEG